MNADEMSKLERLDALRASGALSKAEFEEQKAQLLGNQQGLPSHKSGYRWTFGRVLMAAVGIPAMLMIILSVVGGGAAVTALRGGPVPAHVSIIPKPHLKVRDVVVDDSCTKLFDYCVRIACEVANDGDGSGPLAVKVELITPGKPTVSATESVVLAAGTDGKVTHDFRDARLSDKGTQGRCSSL